jgi:hypothetical protein
MPAEEHAFKVSGQLVAYQVAFEIRDPDWLHRGATGHANQ